ncbi:MAG: hypothetical protein E7172_01405 [Firmicutes bacterium]|nr:hypothetical protein [Bacillota bacterium]
MGVSKRFIVTKKQMEGAITYLEYERIHGVSFKPKKSEFDDMINVSKVVVINPSLIEKLVDKKCKRTLEKLIKMTGIIYEQDDEDGDVGLSFILNEIEKFRQLLDSKYKEYMDAKEYKLYLKKLEIIENEVKLRKKVIESRRNIEPEKKSKGR